MMLSLYQRMHIWRMRTLISCMDKGVSSSPSCRHNGPKRLRDMATSACTTLSCLHAQRCLVTWSAQTASQKRKNCAFWRPLNEKPSTIPCCQHVSGVLGSSAYKCLIGRIQSQKSQLFMQANSRSGVVLGPPNGPRPIRC